jgi:hypothetical protein
MVQISLRKKDAEAMTWTIDKIEHQLLSAEIGSVSFPASEVVDAVNRAEGLLGSAWIEAQTRNQKGLGPAMQIIGMGLRLKTVESLSGNKELLDKLRKQHPSADAELTGIHLLCSRCPDVEVELFPTVGNRFADFRARRGSEEWTTVEVGQVAESEEHKHLKEILKRLTKVFRSLDNPFSLEVIFRREPTDTEFALLVESLPQFCIEGGFKNVRLNDGLGVLLLNHVPLGQMPYSSVSGLDDVPYIGLSVFFRIDQVVTAKIAFTDDRAERMLREQSGQLPKGKRGLIMISGPSSESELSVWRPLILRRFQPAILTRIGGVCLFDGGMVPSGTKTGWEIQAHLILNPHAASPLPSWIEETVIGADDAFESSFSKASTD